MYIKSVYGNIDFLTSLCYYKFRLIKNTKMPNHSYESRYEAPRHLELDARRAVLASLALSTLLTGAYHGSIESGHLDSSHIMVEDLPVPGSYETVSTDRSTKVVGDGKPEVRTTPTDIMNSKDTPLRQIRIAVGEYAPEFNNSPESKSVDIDAATGIRSALDALKKEGWTDLEVRIQGRASAEDDSAETDGGVQTPNAKNQALADRRGDVFSQYLEDTVDVKDVKVMVLPGVEATVSGGDVAVLEAMAKQEGFTNINQLIQSWNNGAKVSAEASDRLMTLLGRDRSVDVTIVGSKTEIINGTEVVSREVCVIPVEETITEKQEHQPNSVNLPWIIPIVVPGFRRVRGKRRFKYTAEMQDAAIKRMQEHGYLGDGTKSNVATPVESEPETPPVAAIEANVSEKAAQRAVWAEQRHAEEKRIEKKVVWAFGGAIAAALLATGALGLINTFDDSPNKSDSGVSQADDCDDLPQIEEVIRTKTVKQR